MMSVVFFSYSHKDEELRDRLETHFALLKREGLIEAWHDRRIFAGDEFSGRISEELERADIILLLVSPDFIASDYCYDVEMTRAMERHEAGEARVIPIILRPCDWKTAPFGKIQGAPKDAQPITQWPDLDEAFLDVVTKIREALRATERTTKIVTSAPVDNAIASEELPRSSNLRVRKTFTDSDKDQFLEKAFSYMCRFFKGSLAELDKRNQQLSTSFRQIDANRFTAVIYENGNAASRCRIALGGAMGRGITYSMNDRDNDNSFNEQLNVEADNHGMYLAPLGMAHWGQDKDAHLTFEGAAEYYWSILMHPIQDN